MGFIKSMDIDLELAINALDEIEDIYQWELELTNILTEFTLQLQINLDNLSSQVSAPETLSLLKVEQSSLQKIYVKKLKEYRWTIKDQNEALHIKDIEKVKVQEENHQMKEMNMAYSAKIEGLRAYLDEADLTNNDLRSENACLKYKLISLEASISNIEHKSEQLSKEIIDEEAKKYQIFMEQFQANVDSQNDLIHRLEQELEGYNFLQNRYDNLEKEDKHRKREIKKLEETIIELNNDYQTLLVEFTKRPCSQKKASRDDQFKSTTISQNHVESDEESQNKNILRKLEFEHSVLSRPSPHMKTSSLMHEVILTRANNTPVSQNELDIGFQARFMQARKSRTHKNGKSADKNFLSQSFKPSTLNQINDYEGHYNSCGTISMTELPKRGGSQVKSKEIVTSELGSEIDADERKKMNFQFGLDSQFIDKEDIFERENILLSWDENDFPKLNSRTSIYSERSGQKRIFSARKLGSPQHLATRVFDDENESQPKQKGQEGNTNLGLLSQRLKGLLSDEKPKKNPTGQAYFASYLNFDSFKTPSKIEERSPDKEECCQSPKQLRFESEAKTKENDALAFDDVILTVAHKTETFEKTTQTENEPSFREKEVQFNSLEEKEQMSYEEKICLFETDQHGITAESQIISASELKKEKKRKFNFSEYHLMQSSLLSASTALSEKPLYTLFDSIEKPDKEEVQAPTKKNIFVSVAEKVGPMIASASLTYLLLRKNLK